MMKKVRLHKKSGDIQLLLSYGHESIYYIRDIHYIVRMIRKISVALPKHKRDIDWLQNLIESFLILNSRFYDDLITDLIKEVKQYQKLPPTYSLTNTIKRYDDTLSRSYHRERKHNRHRAAHGSNYQRVGIPEFKNDVLPKPMTYRPTMKPPLFNVAKRKDLIVMWQKDMLQCSDELEAIFKDIVDELNTYRGVASINPHENGMKLRKGMKVEDLITEMK